MDVSAVMGCDAEEYSDRLYGRRPEWVEGCISHFDARYLFRRALEARTPLVVEIGTASGVSTAFLCSALDVACRAGEIDSNFEVRSYDLQTLFYADESKEVGDATRAMVSPDLVRHITFRAPATALTVAEEMPPASVDFLFIDANHRHPWPALDLLATLDCLRAGAEVVLHDINLPVRQPDAGASGAKYLFDDLSLPKETDHVDSIPNIGSVFISEDKTALREEVLALVWAYEWEATPWDAVTSRLLPQPGAAG